MPIFSTALLGLAVALLAQSKPSADRADDSPPRKADTAPVDDLAALEAQARRQLNAREYAQAIPVFEKILKLRQARLGSDHPDTADVVATLGSLAFFTGDPTKARDLLATALPVFRKARGESHSQTLDTMSRLAGAEEALMHPDRAASLYKEILCLTRAGADPPQPDRVIALSALVKRYRSGAKYARAIPLQVELVEIRRRAGGDLNYDYTLALSELGESYIEAKELARAEALLSQALSAQKKTVGERHQAAILTLVRLARASLEAADYATAEARYQHYLKLADQAEGHERVLRVMARSAIGAFYQRRKDYARAETMHRQACDEQRALTGEEDPALAAPLHALGVLHNDMRKYAEAEAELTRAVALRRKAQGAEDLASSLERLSQTHFHEEKFDRARAAAEESYELRRKALGDDDPRTARTLHSIGNLRYLAGDTFGALVLFERALTSQLKSLPDHHPDVIQSLQRLAGLRDITGERDEAYRLKSRQAEAVRRAHGEGSPEFATVLLGLANFEVGLGREANARLHVERAVKVLEGRKDERPLDYAAGLAALAEYQQAEGRIGEAVGLLERAGDLIRNAAGEESLVYATNLNKLAVISKRLGDESRFASLRARAQVIHEKMNGRFASTRYFRPMAEAEEAFRRQDYATAESRYRVALAALESTQGQKSRLVETTCVALAWCCQSQGDYGEAEEWLDRAARTLSATEGEQSSFFGTIVSSKGDVHVFLGETREAEACYARAREIALGSRVRDHVGAAAATAKLGLIRFVEGRPKEAAQLFREAMNGKLAQARVTLPSVSEAEATAFLRDNATTIGRDPYLSALGALGSEAAGPAYEAVWDARGLMIRLLARHRRIFAGSPAGDALYDRLRRAREDLAREAITPPAYSVPRADRERKLAALDDRKERLEHELAAISRSFRRAQEVDAVRPVALLSRLPEGIAVVDLLESNVYARPESGQGWPKPERQYEAFVYRHGGNPLRPVAWVHLGRADAIDEAVVSWTAEILHGGGRPQDGGLGAEVRALVWDRIEPHLGGCRTVIAIPDGTLARLPWGALPGKAPGSYLLEEYAVGTISHAQRLYELLTRGPEDEPNGGLLVAGGIDYGAPARAPAGAPQGARRWGDLPGTGEEIRAVRGLWKLPQSVIELDGGSAVKPSLVAALPAARFIHLATHGYYDEAAPRSAGSLVRADFSPTVATAAMGPFSASEIAERNPMILTGLVLAGANRLPGSGRSSEALLTAEEVVSLDLSGTELAVLSACETGLGRGLAGEGIFGLQRAFLLAGARTAVASLWKVDDDATRALMARLYTNLWERKIPVLEALRQAQLGLLRDPEFADEGPRIWAAWSLSGDPGGLPPVEAPANGAKHATGR
jgi:CHAT domain-containing protein